jgi:DNA-binding NtrC family response regulator
LFLDEIGDMNPVTQSKVLRALENRTVERLGGTQSIPVDVRVISATHRNLPLAIRDGKFREDLFYRLRVVTIELPPLRAHKEDIAILAEAFVRLHGARLGRTPRLGKEALKALENYDWPGNVRELKNAIERSLVLSRGEEIGASDLPEEVLHGAPVVPKGGDDGDDLGLKEKDFREAKRKFEIAYLLRQLGVHRWNISARRRRSACTGRVCRSGFANWVFAARARKFPRRKNDLPRFRTGRRRQHALWHRQGACAAGGENDAPTHRRIAGECLP